MSADYSRDGLMSFLDFLAKKGLMKRATVFGRKAAVNALLSILEPSEAQDLRSLDVDSLIKRFGNLKGGEFKPESLRVYRSRLASSLDDFFAYRSDPLSFKPALATRERTDRPARSTVGRDGDAVTRDKSVDGNQVRSGITDDSMSIVFPIPIRPGVVVKVAGIPSDLTPEEAEKIGRVVLALSGSQEH